MGNDSSLSCCNSVIQNLQEITFQTNITLQQNQLQKFKLNGQRPILKEKKEQSKITNHDKRFNIQDNKQVQKIKHHEKKSNIQDKEDLYEIRYQDINLTYKGQLKDNLPHGKGIQIYSNGQYYQGNFINGFKTGAGTYIFANGNKYIGKFINNKIQGQGFLSFINGDTYQGQFMNNQMDGYGVYKNMSQMSQYRGYYNKGKKHGEGMFIFEGYCLRAKWSNGVLSEIYMIQSD